MPQMTLMKNRLMKSLQKKNRSSQLDNKRTPQRDRNTKPRKSSRQESNNKRRGRQLGGRLRLRKRKNLRKQLQKLIN